MKNAPTLNEGEMDFTTAELEQILSYLGHRDHGHDAGWYFGNKSQFDARHKSIMRKINDEIVRRSDGLET